MQNLPISTWCQAALVAAMALVLCAAILKGLLATGLAWALATDIPNDRSLHTMPIPRVGGWGIVPVVAVITWFVAPGLRVIDGLAVFLALVSQVDDRRGLPARVRFVAHLVAASGVAVAYAADISGWWMPLLVLALSWGVNLYNFMDGADGLAGGMAVFGFGGYAAAALISQHPSLELAWTCAAVAGAAAGFLLFNFHPARLFLGDAGSISLGFLAGALGLWGWRAAVWAVWFPILVFAPFISDASVTLLRRLLRGEKFWQAHREHYYQRMVRLGIGHRRTALYWYAVMFTGIIAALWVSGQPVWLQWGGVVAWLAVLSLMGVAVDIRWSHFLVTQTKQSRCNADVSR
ncbi:glycosyltransferase family 4 protein [Burkholderia oklahomensis]|nr:glycosyltransferase family 4 protein [Burkholderia oklahomensis]MDN7675966.1 glycosyltransferase family 4 protein [Burkholderia oklahomensis]